MKYTMVGSRRFENDGAESRSDDGTWVLYATTTVEPKGSALWLGARDYIFKEMCRGLNAEGCNRVYDLVRDLRLLVTVEGHEDGYSEVTIEEHWRAVWLTAPDLGWERSWANMGGLFRDLAEPQDNTEDTRYRILDDLYPR